MQIRWLLPGTGVDDDPVIEGDEEAWTALEAALGSGWVVRIERFTLRRELTLELARRAEARGLKSQVEDDGAGGVYAWWR
jgi:hypothetical protein